MGSRLSRTLLFSALSLLAQSPLHNAFGDETADHAAAEESAETATRNAPGQSRRAKNIDLEAPVEHLIEDYEQHVDRSIERRSKRIRGESIRELETQVDVNALPETTNTPLLMLDSEVEPGTAARLAWQPGESFAGVAVPTPVLVVHGAQPGPTLCLTAAVHGDELNGIEIVRRVLYNVEPAGLKGTLVGVPIVNLLGFKRGSRYLPDRRDLNRYFPGNPNGSSASRIAYSFFTEIVRHCDSLVDLHPGSFYRTNLPQLRADLRNARVLDLARSFASTAIIHSPGAPGSLRRAAVDAGVISVTLEAGEPMRLQKSEVEHGVRAINALMDQIGMYRSLRVWGNPSPVHYQSRWVRADSGGILFGKVKLGEHVEPGELLGTVTDPITNVRSDVVSPWSGRVIGMAVNQVVLPGFAAFHIGIETVAGQLLDLPASPNGEPVLPSRTIPESDPDDPDVRDRMEDS